MNSAESTSQGAGESQAVESGHSCPLLLLLLALAPTFRGQHPPRLGLARAASLPRSAGVRRVHPLHRNPRIRASRAAQPIVIADKRASMLDAIMWISASASGDRRCLIGEASNFERKRPGRSSSLSYTILDAGHV